MKKTATVVVEPKPDANIMTSILDDSAVQTLDLDTAVKKGVFGGGGGGEGFKGGETRRIEMRKMIEEIMEMSTTEVPPVFICPISLEPMQEPVTLCTGQTYDRCNILKWLSIGRFTCPTTMQELWDLSFVPNHTLRHLIHAWFCRKYLEMVKRWEDVQGRGAELVQRLKRVKGEGRVVALRELNHLVCSHGSVRKSVVEMEGVSVICSLLGPFTSHVVGSLVVSMLVNLLPLDCRCRAAVSRPAVISLLVDLLNEGSARTKVECTRVIEWVMGGGEGFDPDVVSSMSLLAGIVRMVKDERQREGVVVAGLKLLKMMCGHGGTIAASLVRVGAVGVVMEMVRPGGGERAELSLFVLDSLAASPEGARAMRQGRKKSIGVVGRMVVGNSERCTRSAVSILRSMCRHWPEESVGEVVDAGLPPKLLLVLQSAYCSDLKQQCVDLLKLCSLYYNNNSVFISKCRLTTTIR